MLPHIDAPGRPVFLTWRLVGSMPEGRGFSHERIESGKQFLAYDNILDEGRWGPKFLREPAVAEIILARLDEMDRQELFALDSFVVMPNHVHLLGTPRIQLPRLMQWIKGGTAREANLELGRSGPFWQREYFDRSVRNAEELEKLRRYIENNPVKAGLANAPEKWPWSSAARVSLKAHAG